MPDWKSRYEDHQKQPTRFQSESLNFIYAKCTNCHYRASCYGFDPTDQGCKVRKDIYDNLFTKIEFTSTDPIAENRLRMISRHYVELMLRRNLGLPYDKSEVVMVKTILSEMSRLSIDKKGELMDEKSKSAVPWEEDDEVKKIREELEASKLLKEEYEKLKMQVEKEKKKKSDEVK